MNILDLRDKLEKHESKKYTKRGLREVKCVVWHHTGSDLDTIESINDWHVNGHGWPGIAYHLVINRSGDVLVTNDFQTISYHSKGSNSRSVGICIMGDLSDKLPNAKQLAAVDQVYLLLLTILDYGVYHVAHRDVRSTKCPGDRMYAWMKERGMLEEVE